MARHPLFSAYVALAAVCFFWGTTYTGIRLALEMFPPVLLMATRFLLSGSVLLIAAKWRGEVFPDGRRLLYIALNGLLILGVANGCLTFAETLIPSGLAALFVTTTPFWLIAMEALVPGGEPLHGPTIFGMLIGAVGVGVLVGSSPLGTNGNLNTLWGFLILQLGNFSWALGSIFQRRMPRTAHPVVNGAIQQFAAGCVYGLAALVVPMGPVHFSWTGVGAMLYLAFFGSIIGFSAYAIALERLPVSVLSIYNYVNPVVAVTLGWLMFREPFGTRELIGMTVIFLGVWLVKRFSK